MVEAFRGFTGSSRCTRLAAKHYERFSSPASGFLPRCVDYDGANVGEEWIMSVDMDKLVSLCKRRGFIFQSSEIYGGLNGFWDYGPLGVELKRNIKEAWWHDMVRGHDELLVAPGAPTP